MTNAPLDAATPRSRATRRGIAAIIGAVLLVSGCSVPRGGGSATSDIAGCAAVLPLTRNAVHGQGSLVLIHRLGRNDAATLYAQLGASPPASRAPAPTSRTSTSRTPTLRTSTPRTPTLRTSTPRTPTLRTPAPRTPTLRTPAPPAAASTAPPRTCLVVYRGTYPPGTVTGADPAQTGHYALIVARVRPPLVDRVLLTDQLPSHLPGS